VALYAAGIFYLSSGPATDVLPAFSYLDKLLHFCAYAGFAFFVARAVSVQWRRVDRFTLWLSIVISTLYGATDEIHQYFVPMRNSDILDWAADIVGSVIGALLFATYNYWVLKKYLKNLE
jgi:VanZ family protein